MSEYNMGYNAGYDAGLAVGSNRDVFKEASMKLIFPDFESPGETITVFVEENGEIAFEHSEGYGVQFSVAELKAILAWVEA